MYDLKLERFSNPYFLTGLWTVSFLEEKATLLHGFGVQKLENRCGLAKRISRAA
jgi:hypothetical protein